MNEDNKPTNPNCRCNWSSCPICGPILERFKFDKQNAERAELAARFLRDKAQATLNEAETALAVANFELLKAINVRCEVISKFKERLGD